MRIFRISILLLLGVAPFAAAADLHGQVSLMGPDNQASLLDVSDTVVFFKPDAGVKVHALGGDHVISMHGKSFVPHVLTITEGSTVRFANDDPILHNVFSTSASNEFDMGLYGHGGGKTKTFDHPGLVRVYCNVHHEMFAYILVLDTPYFTQVQSDGSFDLHGLPAAAGELTVWNPRGEVWHEHLTEAPDAPLALQLKVTHTGVPAHFNKFGKPYDKNSGSGY